MIPQGHDGAADSATYATAHMIYRRAGWTGPLPLPVGEKGPPPEGFTGWTGAYPSGADSQAWIDDYPEYATTAQLGLRMPDGVVGIDVDHYGSKNGADTLAEAQRRWGPLPAAPRSSARGQDNPSGIRFFSVPKGTALRTLISFPELGLGGIEIIQRHHRYAVAWPSTNPHHGGASYLWFGTASPSMPPQVAKLNPLPPAWLDALAGADEPGVAAADPQTVQMFASQYNGADGTASLRGPLSAFARAHGERHEARHDAMVSAACWAAREARAGCYPAGDARAHLRGAFVAALVEARGGQRLAGPTEARREFDSIWAWAVSQALAEPIESIRARIKPRLVAVPPEGLRGLSAADAFFADGPFVMPAEPENGPQAPAQAASDAFPGQPAPAGDAVQQVGRLNLPAEFWDARPSLKHIRDGALSRWACPDAVLGCVLARAGAFAHPGDVVDLGIGSSPLSVFVIPYGPPSAGKGLAVQVARDLLPTPAHLAEAFRERPLGTGEGLTESYLGQVSVMDPATQKVTKQRGQVRENVLFVMDEGESLVRLAARNGSTIATTIRRAWSGELLGEANASADRDRQVERGAYSMGLIVSFQPATIGPLFDPNEVGGGTPHRFLYFAADDDTLPEDPPEDLPSWPGPLESADRRDPELVKQWAAPPAQTYRLTDVEALAEIRAVRWAGLRRAQVVDELDGHRNQYRGRVAAHLAILDGRSEVDGEDWRLAGLVLDVSDRVRTEAIAYGQRLTAAEVARSNDHRVQLEARVEVARLQVKRSAEEQQIAKGAAIVARKVLRTAPVEGLAGRPIRDALGARYRPVGAACLEYAVQAGWLVAEEAKQGGTRYLVGPAIGEVPEA
jgi:hypothetical protein